MSGVIFKTCRSGILLVVAAVCLLQTSALYAALPPEVRRELSGLQKELREVGTLVRKKQTAEAKALIQKVDDRIQELMISDDESDRAWTGLRAQLDRAKLSIPVSFESEVAPILQANCLDCHGEDRQSGRLQLNTWMNLARGGASGPIAVPRRPLQSLLIAKLLHTSEQQRMPKGAAPLSETEIRLIGRWIEQGAEFDGEDRAAPIGQSLKAPAIPVVMATGDETVSFRRDIAPWIVNICQGCHSGANPRGGYSMTTFEQLLAGGATGNTIVPGNPDGSYIVDLVLRQDPIKMPAGQARLKQSQARALETWIREGAHFDGVDAKAPLRSLVPTEEAMEAARLAKMTDSEFAERRLEQAQSLWKRVAPRIEASTVTSTNLVVHGNVSDERLRQLSEWGESQVASLTKQFPLPSDGMPWRGRLIVFVGKDRFDYEEFNTVLMEGRRTPPAVSGHTVTTPGFDVAYVAMHDTGDDETDSSLSAKLLLNSLLSQAYLGREGDNLPDWLRHGFGLMEAGADPESPYLRSIPTRAARALSTITEPAKVFEDGTFAPDEVGPVGYLLVRFLQNRAGTAGLQRLVQEFRSNTGAGRAIQQAYGVPAATLGQAFLRSGGR